MSNQNDSFTFQLLHNCFFEYLLTNNGIQTREWIIKYDQVCVCLQCSAELHSALLPTRQIHSVVSYFCLQTILQHAYVVFQLSKVEKWLYFVIIQFMFHHNITEEWFVNNPRFLRAVGYFGVGWHFDWAADSVHLIQ